MADRKMAAHFGKIFKELHTPAGSPLYKQERAQDVYNSLTFFDFEPCQMHVDRELFNLRVRLKDDDSLLYRKNSPYLGQKPYKGVYHNGRQRVSFSLVKEGQQFTISGSKQVFERKGLRGVPIKGKGSLVDLNDADLVTVRIRTY